MNINNCDSCKKGIMGALPWSGVAGTIPDPCVKGCPDKCCKEKCGCPVPIQSVEQMDSNNPGRVRFNYGGHSVEFDFSSMIAMVQTDTNIRVDAIKRVLEYNAERHQDTISAKELGSILHIADIGDVDISGVQDNSLFVYQKESDCGQGCEGVDNSWIAWNANEHLDTNINSVMGFNNDGKPLALQPPVSTSQYYNLGWNAQGKVSYSQPVEFSSFPYDEDEYAYINCTDPRTKQQGYVKVKKGTTITV